MRKPILVFAILCYSGVFGQDTLTTKDIQSAAKLLDLTFTQKEVDTMYDGVKENLMGYKLMHKQSLNNNIPMGMWQSPVLPGMKFNEKQDPINWNIPKNVSVPANKNDLAYYNILQLASLIKNKKISSAELTRFFIDRIKKYGDTLQCVIAVTEEIAMKQAQAADAEIARGKLLAPKITTGPTGTSMRRRSGLGIGSRSGRAVSMRAATQLPSAATVPKTRNCMTVRPNSPSRRPCG